MGAASAAALSKNNIRLRFRTRWKGSALKESREKEFHGHENGEAALFTKERPGEQIHDERPDEENVEDVKNIYEKNSTLPPPPLPSLSVLSLKSHKQNGRFVLQCRKKPQQRLYYVQTYREDGRLKGNLVVAKDGFEAPLPLSDSGVGDEISYKNGLKAFFEREETPDEATSQLETLPQYKFL